MKNRYITLYDLLFQEGAPFEGQDDISDNLDIGNDVTISTGGGTYETLVYQLVNFFYENSDNSFFNETGDVHYINTLFCRYLYPRFKDEYITYGEDDAEIDKNKVKWLRHMLNIIRRTYDEYSRLIDQVDNVDLFNIISTRATSRFNDTPQTNSDGIIDTQYATTYTENTNTLDNDNAAKIAEVEQLIKDYYQKWSDEFKGVFIYD